MKVVKKVNRATDIIEDIKKDMVTAVNNDIKFKILIDGMMSIGKTYLVKELAETYKNNIVNIMVAPTQLLCEQVSKKYKVFNLIISGCQYNGESAIVTTPDSLPKIIENIENKPFILYIDEAHKIIDDSLYRWNAYKNIEKYSSLENCLGEIFATATADNLYELFDFTKIYDLRGENRPAEEFEILLVDRLDYKTKKAILNQGKYTENQIIYYNNNVKELEKLGELLNNETRISKETLIHQEVDIKHEHLCSKNKKISTVAIELTENSKIPKDVKYFGFTSAGDAGVEIYSENICDFIAFGDNRTFSFNGEVQANGRIRTKVSKITLVIEKSKDPANYIPSWREYREKEIEKANKDYAKYLEFYQYAKDNGMECEVINSLINFNEARGYKNSFEYENGEITLNKYKLEKLIWSNYWEMIITRPNLLLNKFKSCKTITAEKFTIREFNKKLNEKEKETIKEQEKQELLNKIDKKNICKKYMKELSDLDNDLILSLFKKELDKENYKDIYKKISIVKDHKKNRYSSIMNIKNFNIMDDIDLYKIFLDIGTTDRYIYNIEATENRKVHKEMYKKGELEKLMVKKTDKATEYYLIRKFFENDKGKLIQSRISDKKLSKLFEYLKEKGNINKKKEFGKNTKKELFQTLETIYKLNHSKEIKKGKEYLTIKISSLK